MSRGRNDSEQCPETRPHGVRPRRAESSRAAVRPLCDTH